jgi:hypothetical protein
MAFAGVIDLEALVAASLKQGPDVWNHVSHGGYVVALMGKIAAFLADFLRSEQSSCG